ncbi:MAG: FAD-dependent thymidylate synthase [Oscillospiraceae bacterium]
MEVNVIDYQDNWQAVKNRAMETVGIENGKYPSSAWKWKILKAEHSPIRLIELTIRMKDIPYFVSVHLVRHKIGVEHWVSTQRTDRTGIDRNELPQNALVDHTIRVDAQALINISRKRLCSQASPETRMLWKAVIEAVREVEPELAAACVPECVYRGHCPEMKTCGYSKSSEFELRKSVYENGLMLVMK